MLIRAYSLLSAIVSVFEINKISFLKYLFLLLNPGRRSFHLASANEARQYEFYRHGF